MSSINISIVTGNLTAAPVLAQTKTNGHDVLNFTVAVDGPKEDSAPLFVDCTAWNHSARYLAEYAQKGAKILVKGHLEGQSWEDKETQQKRSKIVLVGEEVNILMNPRKEEKEAPAAAPARTTKGRK